MLYTRHGCSPCFAMQREAKRAARRTGIPLRVVEIGGDAEMERRYGTEVPVLVIPGGETLQGRCGPGEVDGAFRRAAGTLSPRLRRSATPGQATRRRGSLVGGFLSIVGWRRRPQA
jgi:hypothetical protein